MADITLDKPHTALLIADFYADADPAVHDFLCARIFPRQAEVVQSAAVISALAA